MQGGNGNLRNFNFMKSKRSINRKHIIKISKTNNNNSTKWGRFKCYCYLVKINCYQLLLFLASSGHVIDWEQISWSRMLLECQSGILFDWSADRLSKIFMLLCKNESPVDFTKGLFSTEWKIDKENEGSDIKFSFQRSPRVSYKATFSFKKC